MRYRRFVDIGGGHYAFAIVWEDEAFGFHGGSPYLIMDILSDRYDNFINNYLEANKESC